jgi:hypothetical protein
MPGIHPPLVGVGAALDEELVVLGSVVLAAGLPPTPHPTAKTSTAAPPNSAIAFLARDFTRLPILDLRSICPHPFVRVRNLR